VAFPNPLGVQCGDISEPGGGGPGAHWQQWVDPRSCNPWEQVYQTRPTWAEHRAAWNLSLSNAGLCCEASRAWLIAQERLDQNFSEDCLGFISFLEGLGSWSNTSSPVHLIHLMNMDPGRWEQLKAGPLHTKHLYMQAWRDAGHGNRTRFQMCRPDVVAWLRTMFKAFKDADKGKHPGRFDFPEPNKAAAADREDKLRGGQARKDARELLKTEDQAVTESTERKKRTAAATLEPGECVTAWDGVVCAPEEALPEDAQPEEAPAPPARAGLSLAVVLGIGGAVVAGPPGALGGAALGAWLDRQGTP
jgi:hypothetical protein